MNQAFRNKQPLLGKYINLLFDVDTVEFIGIELSELKNAFGQEPRKKAGQVFSTIFLDGKEVEYVDAVQCLYFFTVVVEKERKALLDMIESN